MSKEPLSKNIENNLIISIFLLKKIYKNKQFLFRDFFEIIFLHDEKIFLDDFF